MELSDVDSLKKENFSIDASTEDLKSMVEKISNLKGKIEKEISNINKLYEKVMEDLTKDFKEKIENLKKVEKEIKEKLENEVTKTKEKLENILTEIYSFVIINEKINKGISKINKDEKNIIKVLSYISKINESKINMNNLLKQSIKSIKFSYLKEKNEIKYDGFYIDEEKKYLKKIENAICEINYGGWAGRLIFDIITDKVFYINAVNSNQIYIYNNYENFKAKKSESVIELPIKIAGSYPVIHKGFFYYFKFENNKNTNNLIKYDLKGKKIVLEKTILSDACLGNSQNIWGGYNDINLISDDNNLFAIYASNNNNKRISIALLDENNLNTIKIWNTDSLEKKLCGPIFIIKGILYHIKDYGSQNDAVIYSYDLEEEKSSQINIPFENKGGYDTSLTYYNHLNCLMTVNNGNVYKYKVLLEEEK